ncbi:MAG TPA: histidinol-phosphate transaminase [Myxococcales bacterium]|jgi:histidinol-phosphate aminotransferase|nr:histidinol-phosphate transaminase [Myxococcales bacterium]
MRPPIPQHIETLSPYVPGKPIEETEREYGLKGVIKLASNENPLGPSPMAVAALAEAAASLHIYPDAACFYLKRRLAEFLGVTPEELIVGSGSNEVIELLVRTFMADDDEALLCKGSFVMYKVVLQAHGKKFVEVPMQDFHYDLDAMVEAAGAKTRLIFIANPDNPTGTWIQRAPFERFLDKVSKSAPQALVIMDEAYFEYVTDPEYPNSLHYRRDYPNVVTLRTFSKAYGLAGLRLGYGVLDPVLAGYMNRGRMPFNVTSMAQIGGLAALDDQAHVERTREMNTRELAFLQAELPTLGVRVLPSQANFVLVDLGRPAAPINEAMLRQGVIVRPVLNYAMPNALRITVGTHEENLKMVAALREALKK